MTPGFYLLAGICHKQAATLENNKHYEMSVVGNPITLLQEHELYLRLLITGKQFEYCPHASSVYRQWMNQRYVKKTNPNSGAATIN
jgi:hypothetical protein